MQDRLDKLGSALAEVRLKKWNYYYPWEVDKVPFGIDLVCFQSKWICKSQNPILRGTNVRTSNITIFVQWILKL